MTWSRILHDRLLRFPEVPDQLLFQFQMPGPQLQHLPQFREIQQLLQLLL
jgi:hypothetical protein